VAFSQNYFEAKIYEVSMDTSQRTTRV